MNDDGRTDEDEITFELDNEFILRLPPSYSQTLRDAIQSEMKHFKHKFQIEIEPDKRHAKVKFDEHLLKAKIYDLPSLIESHKTLDRKVFYKVGDVCHIMICEPATTDSSEEEESSAPKYDRDGREKKYLFPHGITPPLKNVRKRRFRRTLRNKYTEVPTVEKEVKILLKTDAEAISTRFEIVNADDEKASEKNEPSDAQSNEVQQQRLEEYDIFGEVSSSDESDTNAGGTKEPEGNFVGNGTHELMQVLEGEETDSDVEVERTAKCDAVEQQECTSNKSHLHEKLADIEKEIAQIQEQKQTLQKNLQFVENVALRQRLQTNLDNLELEERQKQQDHNEILLFLQHS